MAGVDGKIVAIAGASSGIGEATAVHLAGLGARLVLGARSEGRLAEAVARIERSGGDVVGVRSDVRSRRDMEHLVASARERFGGLDVLFSNAGSMSISALDDLRVDEWEEMVDVNVKGVLNGIAAALPVFREQRSGHFVHTASTSAYKVVPHQAVYAATKTAVRALTDGLRQEVAPDIRATLVSPGFTDTEGIGRGGDPDLAEAYRARRNEIAMPPLAVARAVAYAIGEPDGVDVGEIVVRPTAQG